MFLSDALTQQQRSLSPALSPAYCGRARGASTISSKARRVKKRVTARNSTASGLWRDDAAFVLVRDISLAPFRPPEGFLIFLRATASREHLLVQPFMHHIHPLSTLTRSSVLPLYGHASKPQKEHVIVQNPQEIMDEPTRQRYETQAKDLRTKIKSWEVDFYNSHNGKKPSRSDIKVFDMCTTAPSMSSLPHHLANPSPL